MLVSCECFVFLANVAMNGVSPSQHNDLPRRSPLHAASKYCLIIIGQKDRRSSADA